MEVRRDRDARRIVLTQSVYIEKLFGKYLSGQNTKAWTTPIDLSKDGAAQRICRLLVGDMRTREPLSSGSVESMAS